MTRISRRTVLRGVGVSMALPWLEAMGGVGSTARALGRGLTGGAAGSLAAPAATPLRMAWVFIPNGVNYAAWTPAAGGAAGEGLRLTQTLEPLAGVASHVNVVTGLTLDKARANGDGPGDHARSSAAFLTGHQARKTAGNDIKSGISVDQAAANTVGELTRLPSVELGCENSPSAGNCDSGYSCAYTSNISWRSEDAPMPKIVDPGVAFERLFGDVRGKAAQEERIARRRSILDAVLESSARLSGSLGASDRRKLDQFQTSVREIERRIERARDEGPRKSEAPEMAVPAGIPRSAREHIDLMYDLLHAAFQMDVTRVGTFMLGVDGSGRTFPEIGITEGHHHLSHHQNNHEMIEKIRKIDRFYMERFARFLGRLAETREGEGTLLDSCMVMYGGGISDGNAHNHENLPVVLAGRAGGAVKTGRLIETPRETPVCNLYVTMLELMGCGAERFGDSTGKLDVLRA